MVGNAARWSSVLWACQQRDGLAEQLCFCFLYVLRTGQVKVGS